MGGEGSAGQSQGQGLCPGEAGVGTAATQVCLLQGGADATATLLQVPQPPPVSCLSLGGADVYTVSQQFTRR